MSISIDGDKLIISKLHEEVTRLKSEVYRLTKILSENDLLDETIPVMPSPEEEICIKGIQLILEKVRLKDFDRNDINNYDILHKNLRMIRNQSVETKKTKPTDIKELLKIVEGGGE